MNQNRDDQDPSVDRALGNLREGVEGVKLSPRTSDLVRQLREALRKASSGGQ